MRLQVKTGLLLGLIFLIGCVPAAGSGQTPQVPTQTVVANTTPAPAATTNPLPTTGVIPSSGGVSSGTAEVSPASTTPAGSAPTPGSDFGLTIRQADNGKTVTMKTDQEFLLFLGEGPEWNLTISDPSIVSRRIGVLTIRGSQGLFVAHKPGKATLEAVGDMPCRQAQPPCMVPSIDFRVTIIVQP